MIFCFPTPKIPSRAQVATLSGLICRNEASPLSFGKTHQTFVTAWYQGRRKEMLLHMCHSPQCFLHFFLLHFLPLSPSSSSRSKVGSEETEGGMCWIHVVLTHSKQSSTCGTRERERRVVRLCQKKIKRRNKFANREEPNPFQKVRTQEAGEYKTANQDAFTQLECTIYKK